MLSDDTATGIMTCFSNEANSLVKDCKDLCKAIPNVNPYDYPAELLSLQGKAKNFQLHFDPDSTKEKRIFILDTCWDDVPMLTAEASAVAESSAKASTQNTLAATPAKSKSKTAKAPLLEVTPLKPHLSPRAKKTR